MLLADVLQHAVKVVNTSGRLLGYTVAVLEHVWVLGVDEGSEVTTVIEDQVEGPSRGERGELLLQAPLVLLLGLTLPGEAAGLSEGHFPSSYGGRTYTGVPPAAMAAAAWS